MDLLPLWWWTESPQARFATTRVTSPHLTVPYFPSCTPRVTSDTGHKRQKKGWGPLDTNTSPTVRLPIPTVVRSTVSVVNSPWILDYTSNSSFITLLWVRSCFCPCSLRLTHTHTHR